MVKVDGDFIEFNGSYYDINSEIGMILLTYVQYMQSSEDFTKSDIEDDLLLYMKELQYLVGCVSRNEDVDGKAHDMIDYIFS